jgi:hypothetical protein
MRKSITPPSGTNINLSPAGSWLDLEKIAAAELSSEDPEHPFENTLRGDTSDGWKAGSPGPQIIRIRFDDPQSIRRIHLQFREERMERTQEIALFATSQEGPWKELVRQQWMFSPRGATVEVEDYYDDLKNISEIELQIDPGRHDKQVYATLQSLQIG